MTPDEKKDTSDLADIPNYRTVVDLFYKHQNDSSPGKFLAELAVILDKKDEANQQVAKQKDERIAELEKIAHQRTATPTEYALHCAKQDGYEVAGKKIASLESTNAELEKHKLNLLTCATNQAEEIFTIKRRVKELESELSAWFKRCTSLKAENESYQSDINKMAKALHEQSDEIASLTSRLSEALGALNYIYQNCDSEQERWAEETAKAIINNPENARLLERERLRDAIITCSQDILKSVCIMGDESETTGLIVKYKFIRMLREILEALEAHEKEGGV